MNRKRTQPRPTKAASPPSDRATQPVDVFDGVPDHAAPPSRWRLPLLLGLFAVWIAFLLYCLLAARVEP